MAIQDFLLSVPLWIVLLLTLVVLLYLYGTQPYRVWKELGVNGPTPYPFMGNVPEMFDDRIGNRVALSQWQKLYGRIFGIYFFRAPTLVITDPDVLKQVLIKDFNNFPDRYFIGEGNLQQRIIKKSVFFEEGAAWKRIRRIMSPTFTSGKLKLLTHYMNLTAQRLGENLKQCSEDGTMAEAKKMFGAFTLDVICGTAFGLDTNSQQNFEGPFIQHAKHMLTFKKTLQLVLSSAGVFPIIGSIFKWFGIGFFNNIDVKFFEKNISAIIHNRKTHPDAHQNMDFLQLLMEAEDDVSEEFIGDKKLTTEEIVAQAILFIIAGYETTSTTLQYLGYELAKNQDVQDKVMEEMLEVLGESTEPDYDKCQNLKYMEATINETLRMYPPVHILSRWTERAIDYKGVHIPAKTTILIPIGNIGRDPEFFSDPDCFRPDRFLNESKHQINPITFLPFGQGPRACIGIRLAMMELKIALVHILRNVRLVSATPDVLDIEDYTGILVPRIPIKLHVKTVM
uniref:Cytochrome P450 n=1 Tax=Arion vulgaris TaxID=1028688 RepID=A0A0B7B6B8_9EUPU